MLTDDTSGLVIPCSFYRGGTSKALIFKRADLPSLEGSSMDARWSPIFLRAMGSPDPNGRQLDGMGGGISSLSKVAVVGPSSRPDADVDYTFGQVGITDRTIGYRGNCGNISSAIGPYAVHEELIATAPDNAQVRIHNTNTGKIIRANFALRDHAVLEDGDFTLQGVAGTGAPIRLAFLDPGGAATGRLLPTGMAADTLMVPGLGPIEVSMVDAGNPTVFLEAGTLGLSGGETPDAISAAPELMTRLEDLRVAAALRMGLVDTESEARVTLRNLPLVAIVASPEDPAAHVTTRMISAGQPHKATPLTGALCLAAAARIPGSVVERLTRRCAAGEDIIVAHASGLLPVAADIVEDEGKIVVREAVVYRTARRLMRGAAYL